jgi:hypothetical protein
MTIWRKHVTCWLPKATNTHSQHVIIIVFPLQHWLHERSLMLRYKQTDCLFETQQQRILCLTQTEFLYITYIYTLTLYVHVKHHVGYHMLQTAHWQYTFQHKMLNNKQ